MLSKEYESVKEFRQTLEETLDDMAFDAQLYLAYFWAKGSSEDMVADTGEMVPLSADFYANLLYILNSEFDKNYKVDIISKDWEILKETKEPLYDKDV